MFRVGTFHEQRFQNNVIENKLLRLGFSVIPSPLGPLLGLSLKGLETNSLRVTLLNSQFVSVDCKYSLNLYFVFVFQELALYGEFTIRETLQYFGR